jgi:hypothetical protein
MSDVTPPKVSTTEPDEPEWRSVYCTADFEVSIPANVAEADILDVARQAVFPDCAFWLVPRPDLHEAVAQSMVIELTTFDGDAEQS